jgi:hypothetical protein
MAKDDNEGQQGNFDPLQQALAKITKTEKESVVAKLTDIMKRRKEAEKAMKLCDAEATKLVDDFNAGLL